MAHQVLQGGQRHPRSHHVRSKGVTKPMRVGPANLAQHPMMAKQRAQAGRGHGLSTVPTLQRDEQCWRVDRKSTRLNSSHGYISYAVFCLKKNRQAPEGDYPPFEGGDTIGRAAVAVHLIIDVSVDTSGRA